VLPGDDSARAAAYIGAMKNVPLIWQPPIAALALFLAAAGGLATAYIAQYVFGFEPCELCLWQRIPYWAGLLWALAIVLAGRGAGVAPIGFLLLTLTWLTSMGLGIYHSGVEQHWWIHGGACGGGVAGGALTPENLREQLLQKPVKRCDEIGWSFMGLSMATWNVFFSLALAIYAGKTYVENYGKKKN